MRVCIKAVVNVVVESNCNLSVSDIMERININVTDDGEGLVDVLETELDNYFCCEA